MTDYNIPAFARRGIQWTAPFAVLAVVCLGVAWYLIVGQPARLSISTAPPDTPATPSAVVLLVSVTVGGFAIGFSALVLPAVALIEAKLLRAEQERAMEAARMRLFAASQSASRLAYEANVQVDPTSRYRAAADLLDAAIRAATNGDSAAAEVLSEAIGSQFSGSSDPQLRELGERARALRSQLHLGSPR